MFIMQARKTQRGKTYTYYNLVNTIRTPKGPRHHVVLSLGSLPGVAPEHRKLLGRLITQKLGGAIRLLPSSSPPLEKEAEKIAALVAEKHGRKAREDEQLTIDTGSIHLSEGLLLGPVHVGFEFWKKLGLEEILRECGFSHQRVQLACVEVIARLVSPASELATAAWLSRTALAELLHERLSYVNKDALYRASDSLWRNRQRIESKVAGQERSLFELEQCVILYDLTSTYFEGLCASNPKAKRGYSRDHRSDCKQVVVGMVLDEAGFPKATEIYEGNRNDTTTLSTMIEGLERRVGKPAQAPTVVMDRGIASAENILMLKQEGYHYLVGVAGEEREQWIGVLQANQFRHIKAVSRDHPGVEACLRRTAQEVYLFIRSPLRVEKDRGIRERFLKRLEDGLKRLALQLKKGRLKDEKKIQRRIGKLEERHRRAARFFRITVRRYKGGMRLSWSIDEEKLRQAEQLDGCYTLKTDRRDLDEQTLWGLYTMLNRVERSFRYLKSSLGVRPNFHQREHRVEGHIFISILAYHLLHAVEQMLLADGDHRSWPTIRSELDTHRLVNVLFRDSKGRLHQRRTATHPTPEQKEIYERLGLGLRPLPPQRYVVDLESAV
jgi:transposase